MPSWLLLTLEVLCVAAIVAGVAQIFAPAAYITGGVLLLLALEWQSAQLSRVRDR